MVFLRPIHWRGSGNLKKHVLFFAIPAQPNRRPKKKFRKKSCFEKIELKKKRVRTRFLFRQFLPTDFWRLEHRSPQNLTHFTITFFARDILLGLFTTELGPPPPLCLSIKSLAPAPLTKIKKIGKCLSRLATTNLNRARFAACLFFSRRRTPFPAFHCI